MLNQEGPEAQGRCLNCGAELGDGFCARCGQPAATGPLGIRTMLEGAVAGLVDFDRPLYRTLVGLTLRPGTVVAEYVAGRRQRYTNPVKYCIWLSALLLLLIQWRGTIVEVASQAMSADPDAAAPAAEFLRQYNEINTVIQPYSHLISLALMPILALFLRLLFRKSQRSLADHLAFGCFVLGHTVLLNVVLLAANLHRLALDTVVVLINVVPPIYLTWAAIVFNRNRFLPGLLRALVAYGLFVAVITGLMIAAVLVKVAGT